MDEDNISIQERTKRFAVRVIGAYVQLSKKQALESFDFPSERRSAPADDDAGKVLSKQFLHSGTSIGANCSEAKFAQSRADFLSKYSIALKQRACPHVASECKYWIEIMIESNIVSENKFNEMLPELDRIIRILISTTKKLKANK